MVFIVDLLVVHDTYVSFDNVLLLEAFLLMSNGKTAYECDLFY